MTTSSSLSVLICGGGIAGNALALQLLRAGVRTTVVERAEAPRPGGQAVDLRGASREVAERMGIMAGIRARSLDERGMSYVDARGREFARMAMEDFNGEGAVAEIEITRGDLNDVLLGEINRAGGTLDYRYGDWVTTLTQDDDGAHVTFARGAADRFDLVVGADGVHSALRRMAFGEEEQYVEHLGGYMSFFTIPTPDGVPPGWFQMHTIPSAAIGIRPDADPATAKAIITLRRDADPALRGDVAAQQRLIREMLADAGWQAPHVLAAMPDATDFYFDQCARVNMPTLVQGRATLLGDAGFCGSPLTGQGTAMAIIGAYLLAGEIAATPGDLDAALERYQAAARPLLAKAQQLPGGGIPFMLPRSEIITRLTHFSLRVMTSRLVRPLLAKMMNDTSDYVIPDYPTDPVSA